MNLNLLCPTCQKMLQVPEQYAGQQMRCPLCNNTFTVPPPDAPSAPPSLRAATDIDMKFAWVPPGAFLMGSNAADDEQPVHRVNFSKGFYMGVYPVTQAQWQAVMGYNPSRFRGDDRPVEMVSWDDCQEFCQKLDELTAKSIRLPTEAEWEYACRAGTTTEYATGNGPEALKKAGWYNSNSKSQTQPVGKLAANAWGLYDLHGNVWEWCADWYEAYPSEAAPEEAPPVNIGDRVLRGGSWYDEPASCRAAYRGWGASADREDGIGCRVVLCLE